MRWICAIFVVEFLLIRHQLNAQWFFPAPALNNNENLRRFTSQSPHELHTSVQLLQNPFIADTLVGKENLQRPFVNPEIVRNPIFASYFDRTQSEHLDDTPPFGRNPFFPPKHLEFPEVPIPTKPKHLQNIDNNQFIGNFQSMKIHPMENVPSPALFESKPQNQANAVFSGPNFPFHGENTFFIPANTQETSKNFERDDLAGKIEVVTTAKPVQLGNLRHINIFLRQKEDNEENTNKIQYQGEVIQQTVSDEEKTKSPENNEENANKIHYQGEVIEQTVNDDQERTKSPVNETEKTEIRESKGRISRNNRPLNYPRLRTKTTTTPIDDEEQVTKTPQPTTSTTPKIITYRPPLKRKHKNITTIGTIVQSRNRRPNQFQLRPRGGAPQRILNSFPANQTRNNNSNNNHPNEKIQLERKQQEFVHKIASLPTPSTDVAVGDVAETQTARSTRKSQKAIQEELFREQAQNARYSFSSDVNDEISAQMLQREEEREDGKVKGRYSYNDGFVKRTVFYEADDQGYRVVKQIVENLGDGPKINPQGNAQVRSEFSGSKVQYAISSRDIQRQTQKTLYKSLPKSAAIEPAAGEVEHDDDDDNVEDKFDE